MSGRTHHMDFATAEVIHEQPKEPKVKMTGEFNISPVTLSNESKRTYQT